MYPNYPNPFNPATTISYALPEAAKVKVSIYNLRGQLVQVLVDAVQTAGTKKILWNGKDVHNKAVSTGVYFIRLEAGAFKFSQKITLQK